MKNKKYITLFSTVLLAVLLFSVLIHPARKSVHSTVQEGINLSKNSLYEKAIIKFDEAQKLIKRQGFYLTSGDIPALSSLINEFKVKKSAQFMKLFNRFPEALHSNIEKLKSSREIGNGFEKEFYSAINLLLEKETLATELGISDKTSFSPRIAFLINKSKNNPASTNNSRTKTVYLNRLYLAGLYPSYFHVPLTVSDLWINKAITYHAKKDYTKSIELLEKVIKEEPLYDKPHILIARNYEKGKNPEKAIEALKKALVSIPDSESLLNEAAVLYYQTGNIPAARECLENVVNINPQNKFSLEGLGIIERKEHFKLRESLYYDHLLKNKPDDLMLLSNLSLALLNENNQAKADGVLSKALSLYPDDSFILKLKARIEGYKKNYREAVSLLVKAKKHAAGKDPEIYLLLGITYFNQNLTEDSYMTIREGLDLFPEDPFLILNLAKICEVYPGRMDEAINLYKGYLQVKPDAKNIVKITKIIKELEEKRK